MKDLRISEAASAWCTSSGPEQMIQALWQVGFLKAQAVGGLRGGERKWRIIERLGPMERAGEVYAQRFGLSLEESQSIVLRFAINGFYPEPLWVAHLVVSAYGR